MDYVLSKIREFLDLEYDVVDIKVRENQRREEAVFAADYIRPDKILLRKDPYIHFAGSYLKSSYPIDSGEGAARTAHNVVEQLQRTFSLTLRGAGSR